MFSITLVLCLVLIKNSFCGGDPTVSVTGIIALSGVLITGLFVFYVFIPSNIENSAKYEARTIAEKEIKKIAEEKFK